MYFQLLHKAIFTLARVWATYCSHHRGSTLLQRRKHIFIIATYITVYRPSRSPHPLCPGFKLKTVSWLYKVTTGYMSFSLCLIHTHTHIHTHTQTYTHRHTRTDTHTHTHLHTHTHHTHTDTHHTPVIYCTTSFNSQKFYKFLTLWLSVLYGLLPC